MAWLDDVKLRAYISTDGDFVSLGDRTDYPFTPGGSGVPTGWTMYNTAGTAPGDVNWTTQNGRFSISNASTTDAHAGKFYGAYRDFPVTPGHYYIFQVQARVMEGKSAAQRNFRYEWQPSASGTGSFSTAYSDWEQLSIPTGPAPAGATHLRVVMQAVYYWGQPGFSPTIQYDWGVQFQNFALIDMLPTYPEPTWQEISCDIQNLGMRFGRDRFVNRYDVASMTLGVINNDGEFTYRPTGWLRPGRFIRVTAQVLHDSTQQYSCYYGIIDSLTDGYSLDGRAITVIQAVDISSLLSNTTVPTATWSTSTYKSGARFLKLLDAVGWHPSMRNAMPGVFTQQAVMANGRTVRDELGLIADSEGSWFYADRTGDLVYKDRSWSDPRITKVSAELMAETVELVPLVDYGTVKFAFNGVVGNYIRVPYSTGFNVPNSGDIDIQVRASVDDWSSPTTQTFVSRYEGSALSWMFRKANTADGRLSFFVYGLGNSRVSTAPVPVANGVPCWLRVMRRASDGRIQFFWAPDQDSTPTMSQWQQLGADVTSTAGAMPDTTAGVVIGARSTGQDPLSGTIWSARIRDGLTISITVLLVETANAYGLAGSTSFPITNPASSASVFQVSGWQVIQQDPTEGDIGLPVVDDVPDFNNDIPIICIRDLQPSWSRDRVVNEVQVANQGGSSITTVDALSQKKYGPRTYQRVDLLNTNDDPSYLTIRTADIMDGYTDAVLRVNSVQFRPVGTAAQIFALTVWLNWMVRVRYTHPIEGWGFSLASRVQGIEHAYSLGEWTVTLLLDDPEAFNFWDKSTSGGWDASVWDDDLWDAERRDSNYWSSGRRWSEGWRWG